MTSIIKAYGEFIIEGVSLIMVIVVILFGISNQSGNRGVFAFVGTNIELENINHTKYQDFNEIYKKESSKSAPVIYYSGKHLKVGLNCLSEYIKVLDYENKALDMQINSIVDDEKNDLICSYNPVTTEIDFKRQGIYTVEIEARDDNNKVSKCFIRIPVNL